MPEDADFHVPEGVYDWFAAGIGSRGRAAREAWEAMFERYREAFPGLAGEIERIQRRDLPDGWEKGTAHVPARCQGAREPRLVRAGAQRGGPGRALAGRRFCRPVPVHPVLHIFTHDSIGVGEDGPTHQPVEQLISLRAIPGLLVFRPADANEVVETWRIVTALRHEPAVLVLSRQPLPTLDRSVLAPAAGVARGGYVLAEAESGTPDVILLATGSEVHLALAAREELHAGGIGTRVVSMPCWELFDRQPRQYRDEVIPPSVKARVAVEEASTLGWDRYVGDGGAVIGMHTFGASAPLKQLLARLGFTPDQVAEVARDRLAATRRQ